jgi:hypothetical protein
MLQELRRRGVACSSFQLERWRSAGLLPHNSRAYPGAGGSASSTPPGTVDIAVALARAARRGRGPEDLALHLFAAGLPVRGDLLVAAFVWAAKTVMAAAATFDELAAEAVRDLPPGIERFGDQLERADAVAAHVLAANGAAVRAMRRRLRVDQPGQSLDERDADLLSALSQMSTLLLTGAEPAGHDEPPARAELLSAVGLRGSWTPKPESVDVLPALIPKGLFTAAQLLAPDMADALYRARIVVLELGEQVITGLTPLHATVETVHPQNPCYFALEVLAWIVTKILTDDVGN